MNELEINIQEASSLPAEGITTLPDACLEWIAGGARVGSGFGINGSPP
jgi:hypothetical protein